MPPVIGWSAATGVISLPALVLFGIVFFVFVLARVIPGDPCRAFLLDGTSLAANTLVTAPVLRHRDFSKTDQLFSRFHERCGGTLADKAAALGAVSMNLARAVGPALAGFLITQYVFGKVGISLPRTADAQRAATERVSNPQPGDLVFFGSPAYHVGIYAGNGMMWDSPRSGKAVALRCWRDAAERTGTGTTAPLPEAPE